MTEILTVVHGCSLQFSWTELEGFSLDELIALHGIRYKKLSPMFK